MLEKLAGYKTEIRILEKKLKEMDHAKLSPAKVKEVTEAIKNLKDLVKEKEDKRIERKKKKDEAAASKPAEASKVEAAPQTPEVVKESLTTPTEVTKESDTTHFAVDAKVEPTRGTPGSWGTVIRSSGTNGDPLCYVKWAEGPLKSREEYGAYYESDLKMRVEKEEVNTDYVPREEVYNLEADLKSNYEQSIKHLEEEIQQAKDKADYAWLGRLEEKLADIKKSYDEKYNKTAEDENGSGGTDRLKVVDLNPAYDKDPQEKATGYGGDRAYGWQTAPSRDDMTSLSASKKEASLNVESKYTGDMDKDLQVLIPEVVADSVAGQNEELSAWLVNRAREIYKANPSWGQTIAKETGYSRDFLYKFMEHWLKAKEKGSPSILEAELKPMNINVGSSFYNVNPLPKPSTEEFAYDVLDSMGSKLFKITAKQELDQERLSKIIEAELNNNKKATQKEAKNKCVICNMEFDSWPEYDAHKKEKHGPKMARLTSSLAFLKKGSFVSVLAVDTTNKQIKFTSLDNKLHGWAPLSKFAAMDVPEAKLVDHEWHKDEVLAESGHELLVTCPHGSNNVIWREIVAPPATPESLNEVAAKKCPECGEMLEYGRHGMNGKPCKLVDEQPAKTSAKECPDCHGNFVGAEGDKCPTCGRFAVKADMKNWYYECPKCQETFESQQEVRMHDKEHPEHESDVELKTASNKVSRGCDQCEATMINGVFCHETGCPNARKEREQEDMEMESSLHKDAHIRHEDGKWVIYSHDYKKKLGTYDTEAEAKKRLGQIEYFKHQGSLKPLSKKEAKVAPGACPRCGTDLKPGTEFCDTCKKNLKEANVMETKCEGCGKELGPEVFLSKWPVCGACTKKRHEQAVGKRKKANQDVSLEQQVQSFKDRMSAVTERLANPPTKTAAETPEQAEQGEKVIATPELIESLERGIDLLEQKVGEEIAPEYGAKLEEMENLLWSVEDSLGLAHPLPEHEKAEPEHATEVEKREDVEKESDMSNVPPTEPAPVGFRYAWEPTRREWIMVADPAATGTGTGGTY